MSVGDNGEPPHIASQDQLGLSEDRGMAGTEHLLRDDRSNPAEVASQRVASTPSGRRHQRRKLLLVAFEPAARSQRPPDDQTTPLPHADPSTLLRTCERQFQVPARSIRVLPS
jgi:hypothetical protein